MDLQTQDAMLCSAVVIKNPTRLSKDYPKLIRDCAGALRIMAQWQTGH